MAEDAACVEWQMQYASSGRGVQVMHLLHQVAPRLHAYKEYGKGKGLLAHKRYALARPTAMRESGSRPGL